MCRWHLYKQIVTFPELQCDSWHICLCNLWQTLTPFERQNKAVDTICTRQNIWIAKPKLNWSGWTLGETYSERWQIFARFDLPVQTDFHPSVLAAWHHLPFSFPFWFAVWNILWSLQNSLAACQSRRECKIFQVRGIFPYWTRKGPCVILHTVLIYTHFIVLHSVCNFTQCV